MAAVIDLRTGAAVPPGYRPVEGGTARRPALTLIEGGRSAQALRMRRTYLRRRLAVLAALVVVVGATAAGVQSLVSAQAGVAEVVVAHRIEHGDTLWSVAVAADPTGDPRDTIRRIVELNSTERTPFTAEEPLRVGQELRVPSVRR